MLKTELHAELSSDKQEIEIYSNGLFVCSTEIFNLSPEVRREMLTD